MENRCASRHTTLSRSIGEGNRPVILSPMGEVTRILSAIEQGDADWRTAFTSPSKSTGNTTMFRGAPSPKPEVILM
jgi:hypothetical protein